MPPKILNISEIKWMLILSEYFENVRIFLQKCPDGGYPVYPYAGYPAYL